MKLSTFVMAIAATLVMASSCGSAAGTSATTSAAYKNGSTTGSALKTLYTQYKADGNKLNMNNAQNLLALASLASNVNGLKGQGKESGFYKDFAKGLVVGSSNLVTSNNSSSIMSGLTNLAGMDLSGLAGAASNASSKASSTASNVSSAISNASEIANSVSGILGLFK